MLQRKVAREVMQDDRDLGVCFRFSGEVSRMARIRSSTTGLGCGEGVLPPNGLPNSTLASPGGASRKRLTHFLTHPTDRPIQFTSLGSGSLWLLLNKLLKHRSISDSTFLRLIHSFQEHHFFSEVYTVSPGHAASLLVY